MADAKIISSFVDGENIFESTGYSIIRITKGEEVKNVKLPIRTKGVDAFKRSLTRLAPLPPVIRETLKADSARGIELGLEEDKEQQVFDYTDSEYLKKVEQHGSMVLWAIVVQGLAIDWPAECNNTERRIHMLKSQGLTEHQLVKIYKDIQMLTLLQEDREDFLPENLWASQKT